MEAEGRAPDFAKPVDEMSDILSAKSAATGVEPPADAALFKHRLLKAAGGAYDAEEVRVLLGWEALEAVYEAARDRRLLMVDLGDAGVFPARQFRDGAVSPALALILAAAPVTRPWGVLQFLVAGDEALGSDLPIDLLWSCAADVKRVVRVARTLED